MKWRIVRGLVQYVHKGRWSDATPAWFSISPEEETYGPFMSWAEAAAEARYRHEVDQLRRGVQMSAHD